MQVEVSGQHISIGSSLKEYVEGKAQEVVGRYFGDAPRTHVHFSKQNRSFVCDIIMHDGTGRHMVIKSNNVSDEVYSAFDGSMSKLEKQLRRYKSKLNSHQKRMKVSEAIPDSMKYVISPSSEDHEDEDMQEFDVDNPVIVAEKPTSIMSLSVGEAVMKMDLENLPALMFKNAKTERVNVVYYRKDGNISWVDSK